MNKNVLIVLVGGFVVAILVAVLVQASLGGKKVDDNAPRTQVLVAAKDLALGKELAENDLKWQTWPGDTAFSGAIIRKDDKQKPSDALKGRLISHVSAGQPVLSSYIFKEGKGNLVAASLGKGMRAIAISVKADTMAGGFVSPGDYVDVILSYKVNTDARENPAVQSLVSKNAAETILGNVKVLAVDQEATRGDEDKAKIARTVTLEVDQDGAQKLALASDMGDMTLALRGIGDTKQSSTNATTDVQVGKVMRDVARIQGGGDGGGSVRIYNGDQMQDVRIRGGGPQIPPEAIKSKTDDKTGQAGQTTADEDPAEGDQ